VETHLKRLCKIVSFLVLVGCKSRDSLFFDRVIDKSIAMLVNNAAAPGSKVVFSNEYEAELAKRFFIRIYTNEEITSIAQVKAILEVCSWTIEAHNGNLLVAVSELSLWRPLYEAKRGPLKKENIRIQMLVISKAFDSDEECERAAFCITTGAGWVNAGGGEGPIKCNQGFIAIRAEEEEVMQFSELLRRCCSEKTWVLPQHSYRPTWTE
jgi:hypothetical protein